MNRTKRAVWIAVLFAIPYVPVMWVGLYNRVQPALFGVPLFYWFQFLWIIVTAIITAAAYFAKA